MPIIKKPESPKVDKQFRVRINEDILQEIESYCAWAELPSKDYFIEQASLMALRKDKDWRLKQNKLEKENII